MTTQQSLLGLTTRNLLPTTILEEASRTSKNKIIRKPWSYSEDKQLQAAINRLGPKWLQVAANIPHRNPSQCAQRWKRIKPSFLKRGQPWTQEEDVKLLQLMKIYQKNWIKIAREMKNRSSKQIRERFINKLNPEINQEAFKEEEDQIIFDSYSTLGSKWTKIAKLLPGRPENMVKNRFYSHIRKHYMNLQNPYYIVPELNQKECRKKIRKVTTKPQLHLDSGNQKMKENPDKVEMVKIENNSEPLDTPEAQRVLSKHSNVGSDISQSSQIRFFSNPQAYPCPILLVNAQDFSYQYLYSNQMAFSYQYPFTCQQIPITRQEVGHNQLVNSPGCAQTQNQLIKNIINQQ